MTTRRSFLTQCLALAAAPAIVRADSLMRIVPREAVVIVPTKAEIAAVYSKLYEFILRQEEDRIIKNLLYGQPIPCRNSLEDLLAP